MGGETEFASIGTKVGLGEMRDLLGCTLPAESRRWVDGIGARRAATPPYRKIVDTIASLQREFSMEPVRYAALRTALARLDPPVRYQKDADLAELCMSMSHMSQRAIWADRDRVELDQSAANAIRAIEAAVAECEMHSRRSGGRGGRRSA